MWTDTLFTTISRLSYYSSTQNKSTSLATFTAAGVVRRGLQAAGFNIEKAPGFGRKREMLKGFFANTKVICAPKDKPAYPTRVKANPSWHLVPLTSQKPKHIVIIGAGLAGSHTAFVLAQKGIKVTILERHKVGSGASGNPQGILYSKLSHEQGVYTAFNINAYLFACRFYRQNGFYDSYNNHSPIGDNCGVLQLAQKPEQEKQYKAIAQQYQQSPELVYWLDAKQASQKAGVTLLYGGLWFPQAGWFSPPKLCQALIQHPNIKVIEQTTVQRLQQLTDNKWELLDDENNTTITSDAVIIACAYSAKHFEQCATLPTKAIRGQISLAEESEASKHLKAVLCGTGYIAPALKGQHCIGATFNLKSKSKQLQEEDHRQNLLNASIISSSFSDLTTNNLENGRVSFRCTTPDYLPLVGPVANEPKMLEQFAQYRTNSKAVIDHTGDYWPNLYLNIGHGSKGLNYTPLCAEMLTCMITGEPLPLPRDQAIHLHSARFLMRDLARNRL